MADNPFGREPHEDETPECNACKADYATEIAKLKESLQWEVSLKKALLEAQERYVSEIAKLRAARSRTARKLRLWRREQRNEQATLINVIRRADALLVQILGYPPPRMVSHIEPVRQLMRQILKYEDREKACPGCGKALKDHPPGPPCPPPPPPGRKLA